MDELTALAQTAGRGDPEAVARFVRSSQAEVWRCCAGLVGRHAADDVTQDVYLRALRALPSFEARSTARTWLLSIARRACADWVRGRQRQAHLADRLAGQPLAPPDVPATDAVELDEAVAGLDADRKEAFVLTQVLGLSYAEAADVCGCPIGTIRSRVARARLDLLEALGDGAGNQRRLGND